MQIFEIHKFKLIFWLYGLVNVNKDFDIYFTSRELITDWKPADNLLWLTFHLSLSTKFKFQSRETKNQEVLFFYRSALVALRFDRIDSLNFRVCLIVWS